MAARSVTGLILIVLIVLTPSLDAQEAARTGWDLTEMYPDRAAFLDTRELVGGRVPAIEGCRGTLGTSPQRMASNPIPTIPNPTMAPMME